MKKKKGFHPWKKIKEVAGKIGTLNLVLILMFIFCRIKFTATF